MRCLNPAAYGMPVCRYHGARNPQAVKRNTEHGRYKTGQFSQATKMTYKVATLKLAELERLGFSQSLMEGLRTRGPKPKLKPGAHH